MSNIVSTEQRVTRKIEFDAGHRVLGHGSKCRHIHGHRYVAEVTVSASELDTLGMVVDFSILKGLVGTWVDERWDHNILLHEDDPLAKLWQEMECDDARHAEMVELFGGKAPFIMGAINPTAEAMAKALFHVAVGLLQDHPIVVKRVRLYETPNCWADYSEELVHGDDR